MPKKPDKKINSDDLFDMRKILNNMIASEKEGTDKQLKLLKLLHAWIQFEMLYRKIFLPINKPNNGKTNEK